MKRILVVDDEQMNLKMATFILQQNGYMVLTASSGMECLHRLEEATVDLILLDIEMPIMNGIKTLEHIRENNKYDNIPVMFLTANSNKGTVLEAGMLGTAGYIKKPYMPNDFIERIRKVI